MSAQIKVAVLGAAGRMGSEAVKAVTEAADMELVASLGRGDDLSQILEAGATHIVDLSVPASTEDNVRFAVGHGLHAVVGTTGWDDARRANLEALLSEHPEAGVLIAPNFALGSVLASAFAATAAKYFESVEIIELHHPNKVDAPSGTAVRTAELIAKSREAAGVPASPDATETQLDGARGAVVDGITSIRSACVAWWPTRKCSLADPASSSRCAMIPLTVPRSCRASFWACALLAPVRG